jgi:thioesterase domain-containing protein
MVREELEHESDGVTALGRALQETLDHEIPLAHAIGLTVARYDAAGLALRAPLGPNTNHKSTVFAGSLNAVATLAGWGFVWLLLRERGLCGIVVIHESAIQYRLPVRDDFVAICRAPQPEELDAFVAALHRRGKARLTLAVEICDGDERTAVVFTGSYVAVLDR